MNTMLAPMRRLVGKGESGTDDFWALKDVSFEVQPGEVIGIIGRNGAGKSTLLKILSHITPPTKGRIGLQGRVASLLEVGTGFHPELTGRENIYLNGAMLGMRRGEIRRKFDEIVDFSEVEKFLDTPVKRYSSGMYVRLAFAVAAHLEPEILIVDEVLAVGDAQFQKKCIGKMQEVSRGVGRTVLFVSHNMSAVRKLCTKCILLNQNKLAEFGPVDEVIQMHMSLSTTKGLASDQKFRRPNDAPVWMERATVFPTDDPARAIRMGDRLTIATNFCGSKPIEDIKFGWVLANVEGTRLVGANNHYQGSVNTNLPSDSGTIQCHLDSVPLMPGYYAMSLYLGTGASDCHVEIDSLGFYVEEHDLWGNGKLPPSNASAMYWPCQIQIGGSK
ncbi:MAG: ABC transporter ATP-binding protein [Planctomycetota bacterium]|nr:ABC transporter ATP-binding protein [Planctomycetota bacterium]